MQLISLCEYHATNFYTEGQSFKNRSQQNEHVFIYNVISKRMLSYNHLSIFIFKCQFKILFRKFPQVTRKVSPSYYYIWVRLGYSVFDSISYNVILLFGLQIEGTSTYVIFCGGTCRSEFESSTRHRCKYFSKFISELARCQW